MGKKKTFPTLSIQEVFPPVLEQDSLIKTCMIKTAVTAAAAAAMAAAAAAAAAAMAAAAAA